MVELGFEFLIGHQSDEGEESRNTQGEDELTVDEEGRSASIATKQITNIAKRIAQIIGTKQHPADHDDEESWEN